MKTRRLMALLFVLPVLAACGGEDQPDADDEQSSEPTAEPTDESSAPVGGDACELLSADEVAEAVGAEVSAGVPSGSQVATGGTQTTCTWASTDNPSATATVTVYTEAGAADSVRQESSPPAPEVGGDAFVGSYASVWGYAGDGSFMAQWYDFAGSDEENLPKSTALALLVRDAL